MNVFNIGDKVIYNPNMIGLKPPKYRPNDWGIIIDKKNNHYLIILLCKNLHIMSVLPNCITHFDPNQAEPNIEIIDKIIPYKTFDAITFIEFVENDIIVDFLRTTTQYESDFNTYYSENTFNQLYKNPMSNLAIDYALIKKFRVKFNIK